MYGELRAVKLMLEVPRLREKIRKYDFKTIDFSQFHKVVHEVSREIGKGLNEIGVIDEEDELMKIPR